MTNNATIDDVFFKDKNKYSLVIAVAKRAREIANQYIEKNEITTEKSVNLAIEDFKNEKFKIKEKDGN